MSKHEIKMRSMHHNAIMYQLRASLGTFFPFYFLRTMVHVEWGARVPNDPLDYRALLRPQALPNGLFHQTETSLWSKLPRPAIPHWYQAWLHRGYEHPKSMYPRQIGQRAVQPFPIKRPARYRHCFVRLQMFFCTSRRPL